MNKSKKVFILTSLLVLVIGMGILSAKSMSFSGGFTRAIMREGQQSIVLSQGAEVHIDALTLKAHTITLDGDDSENLYAQGDVSIVDRDQRISITTNQAHYNREQEIFSVDGWVEILDLQHQIIATGAYLLFDRNAGVLTLQVEAKILRHTDSGPMICRGDSIEYDREAQTLVLTGNASIIYKDDTYQADVCRVNLETDEIELSGTIKGVVHG